MGDIDFPELVRAIEVLACAALMAGPDGHSARSAVQILDDITTELDARDARARQAAMVRVVTKR